jgi:hypothetical protein
MNLAVENYERWCELVDDVGPSPTFDQIQYLLQLCPDLDCVEARWLRSRPSNDNL